MSLTDIVRTVAKNVRQTVSDPGEMKEKAKDLPLNVLQTALTGVGQALMLSDRVRTRLRNLLTDREPKEQPSGEQETWATATEEPSAKPARREPVIFAPRPSPAPAAEPPNGSSPTATTPAPADPTASPTETTPAEAAAPAAAAGPVVTTEAGAAEPATAAPAVAEPAAATPSTTLPEPLPGYAGLTLASLRARLRGKSVEQVRELLEYEQATTARPEVVQMFTKRLAKLESAE